MRRGLAPRWPRPRSLPWPPDRRRRTGGDARPSAATSPIRRSASIPWPNDLFTKRDRATETGRRLNLKLASMPRNKDGKPIEPDRHEPRRRLQPGLDAADQGAGPGDRRGRRAASKLPPIGDLSKSLARRSPVVVINARTGKRHPVWAEIDSNPETAADRVLIIRPGKNFDEGERYIVALRNLKQRRRQPIPAGRNFRLYRDRTQRAGRLVERRRAHFERAVPHAAQGGGQAPQPLPGLGLHRGQRQSLSGRALHIRNRGVPRSGRPQPRRPQGAGAARRSSRSTRPGTSRLPRTNASRGAWRARSPRPASSRARTAPPAGLRARPARPAQAAGHGDVPRTTARSRGRRSIRPPPPKARPALYGHGLLGNPATEIDAGNVESMSNEHNFVFCATAWAGFATEDLAQHRRRCWTTCRSSTPWPTACSRASSSSSTWAAR